MRRAGVVAIATLLLASSAEARRQSHSCLLVTAGVGGLTGDTSGDVVKDRFVPHLDLGVGFQLAAPLMMELTYGWSGSWEPDQPVGPLQPEEGIPADTERAFQIGTNPIFARLRYAKSGLRTEYAKPELCFGLGWVQVTRFLRNPPAIPPEETSQMLFACDLGASALFVFSPTFMMAVGLRYTITERRGIVDELDHLDSLALVVNIRGFLPSPRDAGP